MSTDGEKGLICKEFLSEFNTGDDDDNKDTCMTTSFLNPNYVLNITEADRLNSNVPAEIHTSMIKSPDDGSIFTSPTSGEQRLIELENNSNGETNQNENFTGFYSSIGLSSSSLKENNLKNHLINSPDSNDSGIQTTTTTTAAADDDDGENFQLPKGWEKHDDENGAYYWHIKSGIIQREKPSAVDSLIENNELQPDLISLDKKLESECTIKNGGKVENSVRYAVQSLGWVCINEEELTPERGSRAVNKCIVDLSLGRNDINDVVGRWGDGKDLFLDISLDCLRLIDPQDLTILNIQPIQTIRVWGVGRDNGRDFAYVAKDVVSKKHMCHVFRCDTPAKQIAHSLRDVCRRIMLNRKMTTTTTTTTNTTTVKNECQEERKTKFLTSVANNRFGVGSVHRPNNLPNLSDNEQDEQQQQQQLIKKQYNETTAADILANVRFPTPMEEPRRIIRCHYLGTCQVLKPNDIDELNSAMDKLFLSLARENWLYVSVGIAPSTITIADHSNSDHVLAECRVRFLSFMGISKRNVEVCAFVMHTVQDLFLAHVFHCEPTAGPICKTIEAACKLRYQKCLDAHPQTPDGRAKAAQASRLERDRERRELEAKRPLNLIVNKIGLNVDEVVTKANSLKNGIGSVVETMKNKWFSY